MTPRPWWLALCVACAAGTLASPADARAKAVAAKPRAKPAAKKGPDPERLRHEVEARIARRRDALEQTIVRKKVTAAKAGALRTEFNHAVIDVRNKLSAALSDGKLTAEEARAVRAASQRIGRKG